MNVYKISAVTLLINDMQRSCRFYSRIPGFNLIYGGSDDEPFTTFEIGNNSNIYLNLEQHKHTNIQERGAKTDQHVMHQRIRVCPSLCQQQIAVSDRQSLRRRKSLDAVNPVVANTPQQLQTE